MSQYKETGSTAQILVRCEWSVNCKKFTLWYYYYYYYYYFEIWNITGTHYRIYRAVAGAKCHEGEANIYVCLWWRGGGGEGGRFRNIKSCHCLN